MARIAKDPFDQPIMDLIDQGLDKAEANLEFLRDEVAMLKRSVEAERTKTTNALAGVAERDALIATYKEAEAEAKRVLADQETRLQAAERKAGLRK